MSKLIITVGISCSGKSTWVNSLCRLGVVGINRDDLRAFMFTESGKIQDYKFTKYKEKQVTDEQRQRALVAANKGYTIIISDTNLNPKTRDKWKEFAKDVGYRYEEKVFDVEPHICIARSLKRDYTVPPHVINKQYVQMRKYLGLPTTYDYDIDLPDCVLVDIDGCIADMTGIRHPFEWDKVGKDKPHNDIIELVEMLDDKHYKIIFLSGRDGCCYKETSEWIYNNVGLSQPYTLYMRESGDSRADSIIKEELFDKHIRGKYNVSYVLDDRDQVCQRFRSMGLRVLQVNSGSF